MHAYPIQELQGVLFGLGQFQASERALRLLPVLRAALQREVALPWFLSERAVAPGTGARTKHERESAKVHIQWNEKIYRMDDVDKDVHAIHSIHGLYDLESGKVKNPGGKVLGGRIYNDADPSRVWGSPMTYGRK